MNFDFTREEDKPKTRNGKLRCVITDVQVGQSKAGNNMLIIAVRPSGSNFSIKWYAVEGPYFNKNMTSFFTAFPALGGDENEDRFRNGETNFFEWVGEVGAANFDFDENGYLKLKWWLTPEQARSLPEFEGELPEKQEVNNPFEDEEDDGDIPF